MQIQQIRTDLALEAHETVEESSTHIHGIEVHEKNFDEDQVYITTVNITTKNAAKALGKPMGTYITIEAPALDVPDEGSHREVSAHLSEILKNLIPDFEKEKSILVIGLGNRDVTADSLGPHVIDNLCITRHIIMEYGTAAYDKNRMHSISSLARASWPKTAWKPPRSSKGSSTRPLPIWSSSSTPLPPGPCTG